MDAEQFVSEMTDLLREYRRAYDLELELTMWQLCRDRAQSSGSLNIWSNRM